MQETREIEVVELDNRDTAAHLENVLAQMPGVNEVNANPETRLVWVTFNPTLQTASRIYEKIQREGCSVSFRPRASGAQQRPGRLQ
ncbi:cation transporter [Persicimonas caeni]|uniref:cation transporter n=1 Tax=Persicimonas caeni TaxID=2292766 RepID=UPI00143D091F|nr:heavy-metal-associated domain-containing protein [Persicimonas caeni]